MKFGPFDLRCWEILGLDIDPSIKDLIVRTHKFLFYGNVISPIFAEYGDSLIVSDLFQVPFDEILFEFADNNINDRVVIAGVKCDNEIAVIPYIGRGLTWEGGRNFVIFLDLRSATWNFSKSYDSNNSHPLSGRQRQVADIFAAAIAMTLVDKFPSEEIKIPRRLQKAREGKLPLFSYRVVMLDGLVKPRMDRGGTHASPAMHWRRGHLRNLSDKMVPVAPCVVGSPENGIVEKDYDARGIR